MNGNTVNSAAFNNFQKTYAAECGLVYYQQALNTWEPVDSLHALKQPTELDVASFVNEAVQGNQIHSISLRKNFKCTLPGIRMTPGKQLNNFDCDFDWDSVEKHVGTDDAAEALCEYISAVATQNVESKTYVVRFTGGLDSTGILLALLESVKAENIIAITYTSKRSSCSSDEHAASALCKKYGIRQILIEVEPDLLFCPLEADCHPVLNMRYAANEFLKKEDIAIRKVAGDSYEIFDGHGGDHIFGEAIPPSIITDLILSLKPLKAIRTTMNIARLQGNSIRQVLFADRIEKQFRLTQALRYFNSELLTETIQTTDTARQSREKTIQEAVIENGKAIAMNNRNIVHYPFTSMSMLKIGLDLKIEDSFDTCRKRLQYRDSVFRRFAQPVTRKDKGHITGAYQTALSVKKTQIIKLLREGQAAKFNVIKFPALEHDIELISRGVSGFNPILFRIITMELALCESNHNG